MKCLNSDNFLILHFAIVVDKLLNFIKNILLLNISIKDQFQRENYIFDLNYLTSIELLFIKLHEII
jgi:hypothetical protein